jgi:hypothetical protein
MKKSLFVFFMLCSIPCLFAQKGNTYHQFDKGEIYSPKRKTVKEMSALADKSQADHNAYCLIRYHNERMGAIATGAGSLVLGVVAIILSDKQNSQTISSTNDKTHVTTYAPKYTDFIKSPAGFVTIAGGIAAITSMVMFIDAEKWISQGSIVFTGDKLTIRF